MKRRMTIATLVATAALTALVGCGSDGSSAPQAGPTSSTVTETPSAEPSTDSVSDLTGDWNAPESDWTVHFNADGTFVEDFQGIKDFRVGTYDIDGETVSLIGDDGNTDKGTIDGETLVFKLGTLSRA